MLNKQPIPDYDELRIINARFALDLPSDWKDQTVYRFEGPDQGGVKHHINVVVDPDVAANGIEQYAELQWQTLQTELRSFTLLKRGVFALNCGAPAYELVCRWLPLPDREIFQHVVLVLSGESGYILTASFSESTWTTLGPQVERMLRSFSPAV